MTIYLKSGQQIHCHDCGTEQGGVVDDYVIPGRSVDGSFAIDECWNCGMEFEVGESGGGEFVVNVIK